MIKGIYKFKVFTATLPIIAPGVKSHFIVGVLRLAVFLMAGTFAAGCSNLRYLDEGQELYTGSNINIESEDRIREKGHIESELEDVMSPEPNQKLLGMRPWLWIYNIAGEPTGRGLRHIMRNRIGEPPVLFEQVDPLRTRRLMENRLVNLGYFDGQVSYEVDRKNKKAWVDYTVTVNKPYLFGTVFPLEGETGIAARINTILDDRLIKEDSPYRLEVMKQERERIDQELKAIGYFYFHPDVILFRADSMAGERRVDLYPVLKPDIPEVATRQYTIRNVYVYADYLTGGMEAFDRADTITLDDGLFLFDAQDQYKPGVIDGAIFLRKGELYNLEEHNRTLNHLSGLGVFRFVNMRFVPVGEEGDYGLDVRIMLTPMDKKSISAEVQGVTKSNNFAGPGVLFSFTNRNFFGGAEDFRFSINASYETLIGGSDLPASSWETSGEAQLSYPRFLLPFGISGSTRVLTPKTNISVGINYLNRTDAFELTSVNFSYGYTWNRTTYLHHRLLPVVLNVFSLGNVYEGASGQLLDNVLLRQALFEQFILGSEYSFFYNTQLRGISNDDYYFNLNMDTSGNLAWLIANIAGEDPEQGMTIFNQSFAQFFKSDIDFRFYHRLTGSTRLATRLIVGAGFPYGNSDHLPYLKQFTIGGTNSIRAFHPRTLGPGSFSPDDTQVGGFNILHAGDLKLEASLEYRFDITSIFKGALFVDAGNVWRMAEDENTPGGKFSSDTFIEQIALGAGTGLRIDVGFFVLRFDFAWPLAIPYSGSPGYIEPMQPFRNNWLLENLVFNLGIGYPF